MNRKPFQCSTFFYLRVELCKIYLSNEDAYLAAGMNYFHWLIIELCSFLSALTVCRAD